ncbi:MAG: XcyI family restriction endonuclease [Chloroflexota bacterium]|nr:XcyI family restriction endonuclease [Chloroflexota bacterium]
MVSREARLEESRQRALVISETVRGRSDERVREIIQDFTGTLEFASLLEDLAIAQEAWDHIVQTGIDPKLVFAHPDLLREHPETSLHYRGIATLSLKRVQAMASSVVNWESGTLRRRPTETRCLCVARTYNAVISVVITGTEGWTLENGYRNILATIGITEDGALRNLIGQEGEAAVKEGIIEWLRGDGAALQPHFDGGTTTFGANDAIRMVYGSEPDIKFEALNAQGAWEIVSTIEIKSGTDPAGALERLGAIQKSFAETPARSRNFAVLGIVTPAMRQRLNELHMDRDFLLYDLLNNPSAWDDFITEVFHHTLRLL